MGNDPATSTGASPPRFQVRMSSQSRHRVGMRCCWDRQNEMGFIGRPECNPDHTECQPANSRPVLVCVDHHRAHRIAQMVGSVLRTRVVPDAATLAANSEQRSSSAYAMRMLKRMLARIGRGERGKSGANQGEIGERTGCDASRNVLWRTETEIILMSLLSPSPSPSWKRSREIRLLQTTTTNHCRRKSHFTN